MNQVHPLRAAIDAVGLTALSRRLGVTHQAVRKWEAAGRMPRTEWTRETGYCDAIERLTVARPGGPITREMLLAPWPAAESSDVQLAAEARDGA